MPSPDRNQSLHDLEASLKATEDLKNRLIFTFAEGLRIRQKEKDLVDQILKQNTQPTGKDAKSL